MIAYTTVGTDDLPRAGAFYDALLSPLGAKRAMSARDFIAWSFGEGQAMFSVHLPADGMAASVGNGVMIALRVDAPEDVAKFHELALSLGAQSEGAPGPRNDLSCLIGVRNQAAAKIGGRSCGHGSYPSLRARHAFSHKVRRF